MSYSNDDPKTEYRNVHREHPCKNCGTTTNYCWYSLTDDSVYGCRAHDGPGGRRRQDKQGVEFWLFGAGRKSADGSTPQKVVLPHELVDDGEHKTLTGTVEERDAAYRALLSHLTLDPDDAPFPEAEALGYRTSPVGDIERFRAAKAIWDLDGSSAEFLRIPGTVIKKSEGNREDPDLVAYRGTYIPVRDISGKVAALQARLRERMLSGGKYLPFQGPKSGSKAARIAHVPTVARSLRVGEKAPDHEIVRITEGVKKADVATLHTPILTLGVPSANSWKLAWDPIQALGARTVRIAYDSDACKTRSVCTALMSALLHYSTVGRVVELEVWDSGKGIDDALLAGSELAVLAGLEMYERVLSWCSAS